MGKFIIKQRVNGDHQFNLIAANGQVILTSQGYSSKQACETGIASVKANAPIDRHFPNGKKEPEVRTNFLLSCHLYI
jgi:uncharacterized protein